MAQLLVVAQLCLCRLMFCSLSKVTVYLGKNNPTLDKDAFFIQERNRVHTDSRDITRHRVEDHDGIFIIDLKFVKQICIITISYYTAQSSNPLPRDEQGKCTYVKFKLYLRSKNIY